MSESTVVVVRLPKPMLEAVDRLARAQYLTRSEAVRALLRERIATNHSPWPPNGSGDEEAAA